SNGLEELGDYFFKAHIVVWSGLCSIMLHT
ncbi:MAG: hypothetical protein ACI9EV_001834, partial [Urechidicola sp.]